MDYEKFKTEIYNLTKIDLNAYKEKQMKRYLIIAVLALIASMGSASAQVVGVKTNALYWATTTPNVGIEFALADRWTVELEGGYNPWTLDAEKNMKMKHWLVSPEIRYWFCNSFQGHFIGINGNYTQYNIGSLKATKHLQLVLEHIKHTIFLLSIGSKYSKNYINRIMQLMKTHTHTNHL
jgi:hypothetical protein